MVKNYWEMQSGRTSPPQSFAKQPCGTGKISLRTVSDIENYIGNPQLETLYALATYLHISIDAIFSNQKTNPDSTMQQIMAELNSCPEEQKQLALSTLRGLLDGFKNLS